MSSILRQLLGQQNTVSDEVTALYKSKKDGKHKLAPYETFDLLNAVLNLFKKTFIIIDALDELRSTDCNGFMAQVFAIQQKFNVNVYVTSRFTEGIAHKASHACQFVIRAREQDMRHNVDMTLRRGSLLSERPDLLEEAIDKVLHLADGMYVPKHLTIQNSDQCVHVLTIYRFLLAVLYAQHLADLDLIGDLVGALENLKPVSDPYGSLYTSTMQRIQARRTGDTNLALTTICWLFFAKQSLRREELLHALAASGNTPQFEENIPTISHVLNICAGLVVVDEFHNTVGFFHKSFDDFLGKRHKDFFPLGDQALGTTCVRYLSMDVFADGPFGPWFEPDFEGFELVEPNIFPLTRRSYPCRAKFDRYLLYWYAHRYWHDHVRGSDSETADIVIDFLTHTNKLSSSSQINGWAPVRTTGVHVATRSLLERSLKHLLESCRLDPNVKNNFGRSPLSYAAEKNNVTSIELLVKAGADPNLEDTVLKNYNFGRRALTPLSFAAFKGHHLACGTLLQKGALVNYQDKYGRDALSFAAEGGSEAVCRFLLQNGSQVDSEDAENRTALWWAAKAGSLEVVSLLLDYNANINQVGERDMTPLHAAGAEVDSQAVDTFHFDILTQACKGGPKELIPLLLAAGADVRHMNNRYVPPLAFVARNGWTDLVQTFLDAGARTDCMVKGFEIILPLAVESGSLECVKLLLEQGPDITQFDHQTPSCELIYRALGMRRLYSPKGTYTTDHPYVGEVKDQYAEPYTACADEHMLKLLLSRGANPNRPCSTARPGDYLGSPLFYALDFTKVRNSDTKRIIEMLLEHGAKIDDEDDKEALLGYAKRHGDDVQSLLQQYGLI
jgi:ankyrin repeat protein